MPPLWSHRYWRGRRPAGRRCGWHRPACRVYLSVRNSKLASNWPDWTVLFMGPTRLRSQQPSLKVGPPISGRARSSAQPRECIPKEARPFDKLRRAGQLFGATGTVAVPVGLFSVVRGTCLLVVKGTCGFKSMGLRVVGLTGLFSSWGHGSDCSGLD